MLAPIGAIDDIVSQGTLHSRQVPCRWVPYWLGSVRLLVPGFPRALRHLHSPAAQRRLLGRYDFVAFARLKHSLRTIKLVKIHRMEIANVRQAYAQLIDGLQPYLKESEGRALVRLLNRTSNFCTHQNVQVCPMLNFI